ncbi:hypothetical protein K3001_23645 [Pseudomonas aeruginosa]|nr:hypothetical protein [Pseudomonas aeruginosa]
MKATWRCLLPPLSEFAEAAPLHCLRLDARGESARGAVHIPLRGAGPRL